jgi:RHS repeat-associated protein
VDGELTRYVYLGADLCAEADVNWNQTAAYFYQPGVDRPVTRTDSAGTVWYLQDLAGSVSALAKNDGTLYGRYHYSPWGEVVSTDPGMPAQPLKWTARELDRTGLYYLRSRYYLASTGRFLSEDGIGLAGGLSERTPDPFGDPGLLRREQPGWGGCDPFGFKDNDWADDPIEGYREAVGSYFGAAAFWGGIPVGVAYGRSPPGVGDRRGSERPTTPPPSPTQSDR